MPNTLPSTLKPRIIKLNLTKQELNALQSAYKELHDFADKDANKCFGYFPAFKKEGITSDLPACQAFAKAMPKVTFDGKDYNFNFIRLSLKKQVGDSPYHLDTDAGSALSGGKANIATKYVWRVLINVHEELPRQLGYLDTDSSEAPLEMEGGYIHCPDTYVTDEMRQKAILKKREGNSVEAVLFCASKVLHTGQDTDEGHFVMGYGLEEDM